MNTITAFGNLVRDPDHRYVNGTDLVTATLACNTRYKDGKGEWTTDTTFIDVEVWGLFGQDLQTLKKGQGVCIMGSLRQTNWEDKETGAKKSRLYIRPTKILPTLRRNHDDVAAPQATTPSASLPGQSSVPDYQDDVPL